MGGCQLLKESEEYEAGPPVLFGKVVNKKKKKMNARGFRPF